MLLRSPERADLFGAGGIKRRCRRIGLDCSSEALFHRCFDDDADEIDPEEEDLDEGDPVASVLVGLVVVVEGSISVPLSLSCLLRRRLAPQLCFTISVLILCPPWPL